MFISDFAIKRPIVTVTVMLALVVFGIASLLRLQTDEFPDIQQPMIAVSISYPGASPDVVERELVDPIEDAFSSITGVDWQRTTSTSTDGLAQFLVVFDLRQGHPASVAGHSRRDFVQARGLADGDERAGVEPARSGRDAGRVAHAHVDDDSCRRRSRGSPIPGSCATCARFLEWAR